VRVVTAAGLALVMLLAAASALAWLDDSPLVPRGGGVAPESGAPAFLVLAAAAYATYVAGLLVVRRGARLACVLTVAVAVQLVPLGAPLVLSTDAWTYWSYGWLGTEDENPYRDPPSSRPDNPALPHMGAAWVDTTSVYGPVFTLASEPLAGIAGDDERVAAWTYKLLAALAMVAATILVTRLTVRPAVAAAFVGWNPLLALHAAGGGHNDAWMGVLLVAALVLGRHGRPVGAGAAWAASILVKWISLPLLALHALSPATPTRPRLAGAVLATLAVGAVAASVRYGSAWLEVVSPLSDNAARATSFAIPSRLEQLGVPETVALALAGLTLVGAFVVLGRQARLGHPRLAAGACLLLLTTPYLAAWYLLWAVPLAAADESDRTARLTALALGAYLLPQGVPL
jgi:hypothetical protein